MTVRKRAVGAWPLFRFGAMHELLRAGALSSREWPSAPHSIGRVFLVHQFLHQRAETMAKAPPLLYAANVAMALVLTSLVFRIIRDGKSSKEATANVIKETDWNALVEVGDTLAIGRGPEQTVLLFLDYECKYCRALAVPMDSLIKARPHLRILVRHLPSPVHALSAVAARGAICASRSGHFPQYHTLLLTDSGWQQAPDWEAIAARAGVPDPERFRACMIDTTTSRRLERDLDAARRLEVTATPSLVSKRFRIAGLAGLSTVAGALGAHGTQNLREEVSKKGRHGGS